MFKNIYKGKTVFVTGHTGFKGSWLSIWLENLGANVIGYSLPAPKQGLFNVLNLSKKITHIEGNICDYSLLESSIKKYQPDFIFHMAAQALVRYSYDFPIETMATNITGTSNLLNICRTINNCKVLVNITTDKCYENQEKNYAYKENDKLGGLDPYSASKACSEIVTNSYRNSFFKNSEIAIATARAGNVIGGGDWSTDRLVPDCIESLNNNKDILIRFPYAVRPWQFVLEPLSGYLHLGAEMWENKKSFNEGWNFGPENDQVKEVGEVTQEIINLWGSGGFKTSKETHVHEANLLQLDIGKAKQKLNWNPVLDVYQSISLTVNWYKQFYSNNNNIEKFTYEQLDYYTNLAKEKCSSWSD